MHLPDMLYFKDDQSNLLLSLQRPLYIRNNVVNVFDADRNPDQPVSDPELFPAGRRHIPVGRRGWMQHAGKNVSQTG
jgi:hypothetical protein